MAAPVQPWRWVRLEIGLIVNGAIQYVLFINSPMFWPSLGLTSALILLLQLWPSRQPSAFHGAQDPGSGPYWQGVAHHVGALLPLWAGHIALGREQIDEAASQLTCRFDSILHHLDQAPTAFQNHAATIGNAEQLRQTQAQLEELASALPETPDGNALRARIQSARQQLANMASPPAVESAPAGGFDLRATVEDILLHLQFQDRVSQILANVQNDIWRLETTLHEALNSQDGLPDPPDTQAWLAALKNSYTTHEQRALHNRDKHNKTPGPSDITFF